MTVLLVAGGVAWSLVCVALGCWLGRAASRKERGGYVDLVGSSHGLLGGRPLHELHEEIARQERCIGGAHWFPHGAAACRCGAVGGPKTPIGPIAVTMSPDSLNATAERPRFTMPDSGAGSAA